MFVTHDQDEALVMSDRIAVMNQGRIEQVDAPEELYETAAHPLRRRLPGRAEPAARPRSRRSRTAIARVCAPRAGSLLAAQDDGGYRPQAPVWIGRARRSASAWSSARRHRASQGAIDDEIYLGDWTDWRVARRRDGADASAKATCSRATASAGDAVTLSFPPAAVLRLEDGEPLA